MKAIRSFPSVFVAVLVLALPAGLAAHTADNPLRVDLIAGGGNPASAVDVGDVLVWNDGANLYVKYQIVDPTPADPRDNWCVTKTHLEVATSVGGVPQRNGNPIPGQFDNQAAVSCGASQTYTIPLAWPAGTSLTIAAHANVSQLGGLAGLEAVLPSTITMSVTYPFTGGPSYFPTVTLSGDGFLNGVYGGWCVDTDLVILQNTQYAAALYSSYEPLPQGTVEHPENLDLVNWILDQGYVGQPSPGGYGTYTYGDVQRAIWTLIEDQNSTAGLDGWSQSRVDEILNAARANGEGFVPGCNQLVAVVLVPTRGQTSAQKIIAQVTLAELGIPCQTRAETAWGVDSSNPQLFPGRNWATYFTYTVQ